jgi:replicative DNA helicase
VKNVDLVNTHRQIQHIEQNMDQNLEHMEYKMDKMDQNMEQLEEEMVAKLIYTLDERLRKSDNVTKGNRENKGSILAAQPSINKYILVGFNSNIGDNRGWVSKGNYFPKIELRNFDEIPY